MRRQLCALAMIGMLAGCSTSTGVIPIGPDTYSLSEMRAPALGGGSEARRIVLIEANDFCRRQGLVFAPLDLRPDGDPRTPYYPTAFDATFRCIPAGAR